MNHFLDLLKTAVEVFFAVGGGLGLSAFLKKASATQRNEHIKATLTFASQAVLQAQTLLGGGATQQASAASDLSQRLNENGLGKVFTEAQVLAYIQEAYAKAKAEGTLEAVKPVATEAEVAQAELVVTPNVETAPKP